MPNTTVNSHTQNINLSNGSNDSFTCNVQKPTPINSKKTAARIMATPRKKPLMKITTANKIYAGFTKKNCPNKNRLYEKC